MRSQSFAQLVVEAGSNAGAAMELMRKQAGITIAEAVAGTQLSALRRQSPDTAEMAVALLVTNLQGSLNVTNNMNSVQIAQAALDILHNWPFLKIEELALIFKKARLGDYGKAFNRLDIQVIGEWINAYNHSEEKAAYLEKQAAEFKKAELAPVEMTEEAIKMQNEMIEKLQTSIAQTSKPVTNKPPVVNPMLLNLEDLCLKELESFVQVYKDYETDSSSVIRAKELIEIKRKENQHEAR